jgi:hypothetical protein
MPTRITRALANINSTKGMSTLECLLVCCKMHNMLFQKAHTTMSAKQYGLRRQGKKYNMSVPRFVCIMQVKKLRCVHGLPSRGTAKMQNAMHEIF